MQPLISVIVPIYHVEQYLEKCVDSILGQTYQNLEIILVDDGSQDRCPEICDSYQKRDSRIKVIHKANGGLSDARNSGIKIAQGEYLAFVDSDDYIHPEMYRILMENICKEKADISVCGIHKVKDNQIVEDDLENETSCCDGEGAIRNILTAETYLVNVVAWNKLYRRELFDDIEYPYGKRNEDEFTTYKLFGISQKVVYTSAKLYYYVQREGSIMHRQISYKVLDWLQAYEEMGEYLWTNHKKDLYGLNRYRYLCVLKLRIKQIKESNLEGKQACAKELLDKYDRAYDRDIQYVKLMKRKMRLWCFRYLRVNF